VSHVEAGVALPAQDLSRDLWRLTRQRVLPVVRRGQPFVVLGFPVRPTTTYLPLACLPATCLLLSPPRHSPLEAPPLTSWRACACACACVTLQANQFADQEPHSNSVIQKFVDGSGEHKCGLVYCDWQGQAVSPIAAFQRPGQGGVGWHVGLMWAGRCRCPRWCCSPRPT
jgi:hypothetical protein